MAVFKFALVAMIFAGIFAWISWVMVGWGGDHLKHIIIATGLCGVSAGCGLTCTAFGIIYLVRQSDACANQPGVPHVDERS